MTPKETIQKLFNGYTGRYRINLEKRIKELNWPSGSLEKILEKGWIREVKCSVEYYEINTDSEELYPKRIPKDTLRDC